MLGLSLGIPSRPYDRSAIQQMLDALRRNNGSLWYAPDNALGDGAPNLLTSPEFAGGLTDAPTRGGLVTASALAGYDGSIAFGHDGTTSSYAYKGFAYTNGLAYTLSMIVKMDDGNAPTFATVNDGTTPANSFAVVIGGAVINPTLLTSVAQPDGTYRISGTWVSVGVGTNTGIIKYATNNNRTFKVTGYKLEQGSVATAYTPQSVLRQRGVYVDNAGTTPVMAVGDLIGKVLDKTGTYHATQSAVASKPSLQRVNGRNVIQFDGSNDFLQTGITTGNEGWVCAGVAHNVAATAIVFSGGGENATQAGAALRMAGGPTGCQLMLSDGVTGQVTQSPVATVAPGTPFVYEGGWDASTRLVGVDGAITSAAKTINCASSLQSRIGGSVTGGLPLNGPLTAIAYCPVLPSAADRATIRNGIATLQGRVL